MEISIVDISSVLGLCAIILLTINFLLGIMLSTAYKRSRYWAALPATLKKVRIARIHNWTAYVALALVFAHPMLLLADRNTKFRLSHIFLPVNVPHQPFWVGLGVLSLYAICLVIFTTQKVVRRRMGYRFWKNIHLISYFTALSMCLHGIFLDPQLKDNPPDFLDGEKLIPEICLLILISCSLLRIRTFIRLGQKRRLQKTFSPGGR